MLSSLQACNVAHRQKQDVFVVALHWWLPPACSSGAYDSLGVGAACRCQVSQAKYSCQIQAIACFFGKFILVL